MRSKQAIVILTIISLFLLFPFIADAAGNTVATNLSGNVTQNDTSAIWSELENLSLSTSTGNTTITASWDARVNYTGAALYGKFVHDGISLGTFNITQSSYPQSGSYTTTVAETAGTHYYGFQVYSAAGRKGSIYSRNFTVQYLATGEYLTSTYNASYNTWIAGLQGNDTVINTTIASLQGNDTLINASIAALQGNDTLINASILGVQNNDTTQAAKDIALGNNDTTLSNKDIELGNNDTAFSAKDIALGNNDTVHDSKDVALGNNDTQLYSWLALNNTRVLGTENNDTTFNGWLNQNVRSTASPTFSTVNANLSANNATITTANITNLHGNANGNVNASGVNFTNATNLQADYSYLVKPCFGGLLTCAENGGTRVIDYIDTSVSKVVNSSAQNLAATGGVIKIRGNLNLDYPLHIYTNSIYVQTVVDLSGASLSTPNYNGTALNISGGNVLIKGGIVNGAIMYQGIDSDVRFGGLQGTAIITNNVTGLNISNYNYQVLENQFSPTAVTSLNYSNSTGDYGIYVNSSDNEFSKIVVSKHRTCIFTYAANTYDNNHLWGCYDGMEINGTLYNTAYRNRISGGNYIEDNSRFGIYINHANKTEITGGNYFVWNGNSQHDRVSSTNGSLYVAGTSTQNLVKGNTFEGSFGRYTQLSQYPIQLLGASSGEYTDNTVTSTYINFPILDTSSGYNLKANNPGYSPTFYGSNASVPVGRAFVAGDWFYNTTSKSDNKYNGATFQYPNGTYVNQY